MPPVMLLFLAGFIELSHSILLPVCSLLLAGCDATFRQHLKTFLFRASFPDIIIDPQ